MEKLFLGTLAGMTFIIPAISAQETLVTSPLPWSWFWLSIGFAVSISGAFFIRRMFNLNHALFALEHHIFITSEHPDHRHDVAVRIATAMRKDGIKVGEIDASQALFSPSKRSSPKSSHALEPPKVNALHASLNGMVDAHDMLVFHELTPDLYHSTKLKDIFREASKKRKPIIATMNMSSHRHFNERGRIVDVTDKDAELMRDVIVKRLKEGPFRF